MLHDHHIFAAIALDWVLLLLCPPLVVTTFHQNLRKFRWAVGLRYRMFCDVLKIRASSSAPQGVVLLPHLEHIAAHRFCKRWPLGGDPVAEPGRDWSASHSAQPDPAEHLRS